jgi:chemotaxis protein CheD
MMETNLYSTMEKSFSAGVKEENSHYLYPAALFANQQPYVVNTILGSCVAVCLFDSIKKIGGINHFMLPIWNGKGLASPKYGDIAIEKLIEKLKSFGCNPKNFQAKVFGGGEVIDTKIATFNIGQRNIHIAKDMLDEYKIPIVAESTGGKYGRKIVYFTGTGEVRQRYVNRDVKS